MFSLEKNHGKHIVLSALEKYNIENTSILVIFFVLKNIEPYTVFLWSCGYGSKIPGTPKKPVGKKKNVSQNRDPHREVR